MDAVSRLALVSGRVALLACRRRKSHAHPHHSTSAVSSVSVESSLEPSACSDITISTSNGAFDSTLHFSELFTLPLAHSDCPLPQVILHVLQVRCLWHFRRADYLHHVGALAGVSADFHVLSRRPRRLRVHRSSSSAGYNLDLYTTFAGDFLMPLLRAWHSSASLELACRSLRLTLLSMSSMPLTLSSRSFVCGSKFLH